MLVDLGLADDYALDGRAITEILYGNVVSHTLNVGRGLYQNLGASYKQLTAPFGRLGLASLRISTAGVVSGSASDDTAYLATDIQLNNWLGRRDALAAQIAAVLNAAEFENHGATSARIRDLTAQANALVGEVEAAAP
jgi:hypothetical protein